MKLILALIALFPLIVSADQQVIRDKTGRIIGTIDGGAKNGSAAFRDRTERIRYTVERTKSGTLIIRDQTGRVVQIISPAK